MDAHLLAKNLRMWGLPPLFTQILTATACCRVLMLRQPALARGINIPVIASGGLAGLEDLEKLLAVEKDGVTGVISGRAFMMVAWDATTLCQWRVC